MASWINTALQSKITYRPNDVVISVPAKSGTTWTMNIVYQLREHGNRNFNDIYEELKWIEAVESPDATEEEMIRKIDEFSPQKPRGFKSHSSPPVLPFRDEVKYLVVVRNPEEVIVSIKAFLAKHNPEFLKWWGVPPERCDT
jgi:aryl sulfotransferase